jgi:quercetin dioxygenase-like cupin family protein
MTRAEFEAACLREGYEIGEGEIQAHVRREPHAHDFDARLFVLEGSLTLVRGQDRATYGPGEACVVPAGTQHAEHTEADGVRLVYGRRATTPTHKAH